jgi:hypothetical protein
MSLYKNCKNCKSCLTCLREKCPKDFRYSKEYKLMIKSMSEFIRNLLRGRKWKLAKIVRIT